MEPLQLAMWGVAGGFVVESLELVAAIRRVRGWPWRVHGEVGLAPYIVSVLLRLLIGGVLATALGANGQVNGPAGALMIGITAPLIVEKAFRYVAGDPVSAPAPPTSSERPPEQAERTLRTSVQVEAGEVA